MLAIVIPFYKLTFFKETIQSIAKQTDKRFNIYIGDDASPENCSSLINEFKDQFNIVYHRFDTNLGGISLTQHWDRCIALSKDEEWIIILGDDDVLDQNVVKEFYNNFESIFENETNVVRFSSNIINEHGEKISELFTHPTLELASNFFCRKVQNLTRSSLSEYIFKRATYYKHRFVDYPLAWHSDDKAWLDFAENKPIFTINSACVCIRVSEINISGRQDNVPIKLLTSFQFFKDIISTNSQFDKNQIIELLIYLEDFLKRHRKIRPVEWRFLLKYHLIYFRIPVFFKFLKNYRKAVFK